MTDRLPSRSWSAFIETDAAKVATFIAICGLLVVGLAPATHAVRFGQLLCSLGALACVALLSYRDRPQPAPVRRHG